jgi:hypothetical protein
MRLVLALILAGVGCGPMDMGSVERIDSPVISGTDSLRRNLPFLKWGDRPGSTPYCSSTLITRRYILTAAHCLADGEDGNWRDTTVYPYDQAEFCTAGAVAKYGSLGEPICESWIEHPHQRYYSFGARKDTNIWNGKASDVALIRLATSVTHPAVTPVAISDTRPSGSGWSTIFGFGCFESQYGTGSFRLRYRSAQGTPDIGCAGDSGGPWMLGQGDNAAPMWGVHSGWYSSVVDSHSIVSDVVYHKKQIEAVMHLWDSGYEFDVARSGANYATPSATNASQCRAQCESDSQCHAWTWYGTPANTCFLKDAAPNWAPYAGATSGVNANRLSYSENGINRPGGEYSFSWKTTSLACDSACARDHRCAAFSVIPSGGYYGCSLKDEVPNPVHTTGARSMVKRGLDMDHDYYGGDYRSFNISISSPETCQSECANDTRCLAWTYLSATQTRSSATCWLKENYGTYRSALGYISGRKNFEYDPIR